jgi:hypothetical protein
MHDQTEADGKRGMKTYLDLFFHYYHGRPLDSIVDINNAYLANCTGLDESWWQKRYENMRRLVSFIIFMVVHWTTSWTTTTLT